VLTLSFRERSCFKWRFCVNAHIFPRSNYTRMLLRPSAVCSYVYRILYIADFSELSVYFCGEQPPNSPFPWEDPGLHLLRDYATKILPSLRHISYPDRLKVCKLTTLQHYKQIRGDMIEVYKTVSGKYDCDSAITPTLILSDTHKIRGNNLRLQKSRLKYDMRKFYSSNRVVDQWPNWVVTANNTQILKKRIDQYWQHQDIIFDFRAQIEGTGSRSEVSRVNII